MADDGGTTGPGAKRPGIRPWRRQGARQAREPDPLSLRGREDRVVRWIGASRRRRKAAAPGTPPKPETASNVIVLAHAEILRLDRRPRFPVPARGPGRGAIVATLLPFVPRQPTCTV